MLYVTLVVLFSLLFPIISLRFSVPLFLSRELSLPLFLLKLYNRNEALSDADISDIASAVSVFLSSPYFCSFLASLHPSILESFAVDELKIVTFREAARGFSEISAAKGQRR